jgi:hypothetical protein
MGTSLLAANVQGKPLGLARLTAIVGVVNTKNFRCTRVVTQLRGGLSR